MYERATRLLEAELGDELMTLDVDAGKCFGFNPVAASVWRRLDEPADFEQLRTALLEEYEVTPEQCTAELRDLMQVLVDHGLVRQAVGTGQLA
jgi:hypothetical protein